MNLALEPRLAVDPSPGTGIGLKRPVVASLMVFAGFAASAGTSNLPTQRPIDAAFAARQVDFTGTSAFSAAGFATSLVATSIRDLRSRTGLTWDELAKLFGVSRRALHLWASGGAISPRHASRLSVLAGELLPATPSTPAEVRDFLMAPRQAGRSVFQDLVRDASPAPRRLGGLTPAQRIAGTP